jgi:uncharacterized damage-inducible protein DinB
MSITLSYEELLRYTSGERQKWHTWFLAHPAAMELPFQPSNAGLPTVGKLIDHIFLVERRHLQRLRDERLSDSTGLSAQNAPPLFDYGASVRRELESFVGTLDDDQADELRTFDVQNRSWPMTPRKLLFHILLHEIRHWAQIALAVRVAGFEPPGDHDLFYSRAMK